MLVHDRNQYKIPILRPDVCWLVLGPYLTWSAPLSRPLCVLVDIATWPTPLPILECAYGCAYGCYSLHQSGAVLVGEIGELSCGLQLPLVSR